MFVAKRMVVIGQPHQMNKKGYGKRVLYIDLDWINKRLWQKSGNCRT